jgi:hypothetical protein
MTDPAQSLLNLLQLARRAREARSSEALGFVMVNESLQVLRYRQAALWRTDASLAGAGQVAAVSGLPAPGAGAPYTQWLTRLFRALQQQRQDADGVRPRTVGAADVPGPGDEWADWLPAHGLWVPLREGREEDPLLGGLLFAAEQPWQDHDLAVAAELAGSYAHALAAFGERRRGGAQLKRGLVFLRRRRWAALALAAVALFPVQQSVLAPAEVVPRDPFLVRAPQDGVVDRMLVQPNQPVEAGTPLFSLDQTALQTRHDIARKAYDTAQEEYRQSAQTAVTDDKAKLELSMRRGMLQEKGVELAYSAELLGRVQVKAERAGLAVFSDVNDWQGKAVVLGERILTLADPAQVELAIQLPVGERFDVKTGDRVSLYPNADPLSSRQAVVTQVAYSAEPTRDGQVAYRLKAGFQAGEPLPRIGLMGTAKLHGNRVPLIYFALRRPLTSLRQWLSF